MKAPTNDSKRSKRRKNRDFESLIKSSRKHRRAHRRSVIKRMIGANHMGNGGALHEPGKTVDPPVQGKIKSFLERVSGSINYH